MGDASTYIDRVNAAIAADDLSQAAMLAQEALGAGVKHPQLVRLLAEDLAQRGEVDQAIALLNRGLIVMPGEPHLLLKLGDLLAVNGSPAAAVRMLGEAAKSSAVAAEAHLLLGTTLSRNNDTELGRLHLEKALELEPTYVRARASLAVVLARIGELVRARVEAERVLSEEPDSFDASVALSVADVGEGKFEEAEARMRAVLAREELGIDDRATATNVLGDALHGQRRASEAFEAYREGKDALRQAESSFTAPAAEFCERIERLAGVFGKERAERWIPVSNAPNERSPAVDGHVFIVGFPRSGTTLLEQVLAAHPQIVSLEEKPTFAMAAAEFLRDASGVEKLANLSPAEAERFRRAYWSTVCTFVEPEGKIFVDKLPTGTIYLSLAAKLFPKARVLFARRDPRDVVLSCFRQAFTINAMTYLFASLHDTARFYAAVMTLFEAYQNVLPLRIHEVRYERFVEDFEHEARVACTFIGAEWDDAVRDFAAAASRRTVATPSAVQVRRGLYRGGEGQWRAYAKQMQAVIPLLEPWIGPKGYSVE